MTTTQGTVTDTALAPAVTEGAGARIRTGQGGKTPFVQ